MRFDVATVAPQPWKNGGGTTRELATVSDPAGLLWRVSLADIAKDGPFSAFPGLARIHTIIEGQGLTLHGQSDVLEARPLRPLAFDGGLALSARLVAGPCRALNLIYDPVRLAAEAEVVVGAFAGEAGDVVFAIKGGMRLGGEVFASGQGMRLDGDTPGETGGVVLVLRLRERPAAR